VFYPTGVHTGQQVRIDYDYTNPNFARISGRSWLLSFIPALSVLACVLPWCVLAFAVLGRYRLKAGGRIRRPTGVAASPASTSTPVRQF